MENINGSVFLPIGAKITSLSVEVLKEENAVVRNVQYQIVNGVESVVDNISRKPVFVLTDNPNVSSLTRLNPDFGKSFILFTKAPGVEMGTVYRVDEKNGYVYKVSHLYLEYIVPDGKEDIMGWNSGAICILSGSKKSYETILRWLQTEKKDSISGLIVKMGEDWLPFSEIPAEKFLE